MNYFKRTSSQYHSFLQTSFGPDLQNFASLHSYSYALSQEFRNSAHRKLAFELGSAL